MAEISMREGGIVRTAVSPSYCGSKLPFVANPTTIFASGSESKVLGTVSVAPSTSPANSGSFGLGRGVARHLKPDLLLYYLWLAPGLLQHLLAPIETPVLIGLFDDRIPIELWPSDRDLYGVPT